MRRARCSSARARPPSLSATASGLPAPTLQWQTRAANSTGAWSNVTTGTGAITANYTTAGHGAV